MKGFTNFSEEIVACGEVDIFVRHNNGVEKPALLLMHGYPQTSAMWHQVAPEFSSSHHVICPDLRGYGRSGKPPSTPDHSSYSKRAMGADMFALLDHFGHFQTRVGAHDRGARVAHRMGLDCPDRISSMTLLDIAPTREMYAGTTDAFARAYWHWFFLVQPSPLPEEMIGNDRRGYWLMKCCEQDGDPGPFHPEALSEYLDCFDDADAVRASCEDYRAAATIDIDHDDADGAIKLSMPLLVLWARHGIIGKCFDTMALWNLRAHDVRGDEVNATHYMAEEIPGEIATRMAAFFHEHDDNTS